MHAKHLNVRQGRAAEASERAREGVKGEGWARLRTEDVDCDEREEAADGEGT